MAEFHIVRMYVCLLRALLHCQQCLVFVKFSTHSFLYVCPYVCMCLRMNVSEVICSFSFTAVFPVVSRLLCMYVYQRVLFFCLLLYSWKYVCQARCSIHSSEFLVFFIVLSRLPFLFELSPLVFMFLCTYACMYVYRVAVQIVVSRFLSKQQRVVYMYVRVDVCQARYLIDSSVSFSMNDSRVYIRVYVFMFPNRLLHSQGFLYMYVISLMYVDRVN